FLPDEDQGYIIMVAQLPDGASKKRTTAVTETVEKFFLSNQAVYGTVALTGQNFVFNTRGTHTSTTFVPLKPWDERKKPHQQAKALIAAGFKEFGKFPDALVLAFNPPSIRGLGATGGFSIQLQD